MERVKQEGISIFARIFLVFLCVNIATSGILIVVAYTFNRISIEKRTKENITQQIETIRDNFENEYRINLKRSLQALASSSTLNDYLSVSKIQKLVLGKKIEQAFLEVIKTNKTYHSIRFVDSDGKISINVVGKLRQKETVNLKQIKLDQKQAFSSSLRASAKLFQLLESIPLLLSAGYMEWFIPPREMQIEGPFLDENQIPSFLAGTSKLDLDTGEFGGVMMIHQKLDDFLVGLQDVEFFDENPIWVFDAKGHVLQRPEKDEISFNPVRYLAQPFQGTPRLIDVEEGIVAYQDFSILPGKPFIRIVMSIPSSLLLKDFINAIQFFSLVLGCSFILVLLVSLYVSRYLSKPIVKLAAAANRLAQGDLSSRVQIETTGEVNMLVNSFRQMTEDLLKTTVSRDYVDNILKTMTDSLVVVSPEATIQRVNQGTCDLLGYKEEELIGKKINFIFEEASTFKEKGLEYIIKKGFVRNEEKTCLSKDGRKIPALCSGSVMRNRNGKIQGIVCLVQDITERKRAEKELTGALKEHTDFLNAIPDIAYEFNPDLSIAKWNRAVEDILGYSSEEVSRMKALDFLSKEDHKKAANAIQEAFKKGQSEVKAHFITKNGSKIPCLFSGRALKDSEGNILSLAGVAKDLTKILQAEEEKRYLEENLQRSQKMESLGVLAGGVAHDLNNVLSGILSYPDLILLNLPEDHEARESLESIKKAGGRAAEIVQDLLTLARRGVAITDVVNLNDLVKEYVYSPEHEKMMSFHSGINVKTNLEDNLLNIKGSSIHLKKTIMNLVSNAAEAQPEGGEIIILTENRSIDQLMKGYDNIPEGDYVLLKVTDKGHGIAKDDLDKIFEPFYTKKVMGRSGTGLGMAVVWGTVKDHKGRINVKSVEAQGTAFDLYFPATREGIKEEARVSLKDYMGNGQSILVVDDVEEQRKIASLLLDKLGYKPFAVPSGEEAVELTYPKY